MLVSSFQLDDAAIIPQVGFSLMGQGTKNNPSRVTEPSSDKMIIRDEREQSNANPALEQRTDKMAIHDVCVLLADGDVALAESYQGYLSQLGCDVSIVSDGLTCISSLRMRPPHLLILDAGLLWGRAEGILALMEEHVDVPDIPVLVLYDDTHCPTLSALRQFSVCDYVAKPLKPQQLAARIQELVQFKYKGYES